MSICVIIIEDSFFRDKNHKMVGRFFIMKNKSNLNIAELLVMVIQNIKDDPFSELIRVCDHVTYAVINKYFFPDLEKEDLLQESRFILLEAAFKYKFDGGMLFYQFYHMLLTNHFNMLVRKEVTYKRKANSSTLSLDQLVEEAGISVQGTASITTYPEDVAIAKEKYNKYILNLSPLEKNVFVKFLGGTETEKIAKKLDTTEDRVRQALYRCAVKLRETLNN